MQDVCIHVISYKGDRSSVLTFITYKRLYLTPGSLAASVPRSDSFLSFVNDLLSHELWEWRVREGHCEWVASIHHRLNNASGLTTGTSIDRSCDTGHPPVIHASLPLAYTLRRTLRVILIFIIRLLSFYWQNYNSLFVYLWYFDVSLLKE